jgi:DNA-binding transcriptional regulator YiaG
MNEATCEVAASDAPVADSPEPSERIRALADIAPVADLPEPSERMRLRNKFGVSQQTLADTLGVSRKTVWTWEAGKKGPTGENRKRYAQLLALWQQREREISENQ